VTCDRRKGTLSRYNHCVYFYRICAGESRIQRKCLILPQQLAKTKSPWPLTDVPCTHHERRTKIDILFEKVIEHVDAEVKQCPNCQATVKGRFPPDLHGPLQYGNGLKAFAINLLVAQMVSLQRVQQLLQSLIGERLAEATLLNFVLRLYHALEGWETQASNQLLAMPALHVDETSLRVDGKNHWIHVYAGGDVTLKRLHRKRGKQAEDLPATCVAKRKQQYMQYLRSGPMVSKWRRETERLRRLTRRWACLNALWAAL